MAVFFILSFFHGNNIKQRNLFQAKGIAYSRRMDAQESGIRFVSTRQITPMAVTLTGIFWGL